MAKKELEKIFDTVKKIPGVSKIPGLDYALNTFTAIVDFVDQSNSKKNKIKQLKERHKKDMATVHKIKMEIKNPPKDEAEKIKKDKKLKQYFDRLLGSEQ